MHYDTDTCVEHVLFELLSLECRVGPDGTVRYYNSNGQLHRVHGPAFETTYGSKVWFQHGLIHRMDGAAVEWADGRRKWYIEGVALPEDQFLAKGGVMPTDNKCCQQSPV